MFYGSARHSVGPTLDGQELAVDADLLDAHDCNYPRRLCLRFMKSLAVSTATAASRQ